MVPLRNRSDRNRIGDSALDSRTRGSRRYHSRSHDDRRHSDAPLYHRRQPGDPRRSFDRDGDRSVGPAERNSALDRALKLKRRCPLTMKLHGFTPVVSLISSAESAEALTLLRSLSYGGSVRRIHPLARARGLLRRRIKFLRQQPEITGQYPRTKQSCQAGAPVMHRPGSKLTSPHSID